MSTVPPSARVSLPWKEGGLRQSRRSVSRVGSVMKTGTRCRRENTGAPFTWSVCACEKRAAATAPGSYPAARARSAICRAESPASSRIVTPRARTSVALPALPLPRTAISIVRLDPRVTEPAVAPGRHRKLVRLLEASAADRPDEHLGDAVAAVNGDRALPEVDEEDPDLATVVGVHRSGRVQ